MANEAVKGTLKGFLTSGSGALFSDYKCSPALLKYRQNVVMARFRYLTSITSNRSARVEEIFNIHHGEKSRKSPRERVTIGIREAPS
jgi:hypothetical protein